MTRTKQNVPTDVHVDEKKNRKHFKNARNNWKGKALPSKCALKKQKNVNILKCWDLIIDKVGPVVIDGAGKGPDWRST